MKSLMKVLRIIVNILIFVYLFTMLFYIVFQINSKYNIFSQGDGVIRFIDGIPALNSILSFIGTSIGIISCMVVPAILISIYILAVVVDHMHESSKHRKRIIRKRKRRRERYIKEGLFVKSKVSI